VEAHFTATLLQKQLFKSAAMSTNARPSDQSTQQSGQTYFQSQRILLVSEIAQSLDSVLTNLNRLNRSLESIIAVGNDFSSIEALWSTFEDAMGEGAVEKRPEPEQTDEESETTGSGENEDDDLSLD